MVAEPCLLCLETNRELVGSISVNSMEWQTENIKYLIEKHLWPMETIQLSGLMCKSCWQQIKDFHQFYIRIEKAHSKLATLVDKYNETVLSDIGLKDDFKNIFKMKNVLNDVQLEDCEGLFDNDVVAADNFKPEILLEHSLPSDFVIDNKTDCIKEERHDQEFCSENMKDKEKCKKIQRRKHLKTNLDGISKYIEDPLNKEEPPKAKRLKEITKKSLCLQGKYECKASEDHDYLDSDANSEILSDSQPVERTKKKRKNPDEKTGQEYDRFISDNFQIVCSLCHVSLENFIALRKHFRDKHNKRGFVICCKKKIFSRPLLVDHIHIHLDPNYFKCQQCDKVYSERSTLESHAKVHEVGQQDRNHICDTCGKTFVGATQLENHKRTHDPGYEKQFSCEECGKLFTTSYSLNYHIQAIHHNKFVSICDICGKTMRCRNQFKLHMEKHNSKESMSMNCDICGLRLTDRRGLRRHKNSQHPVGGKKEYSCHLCPKVSPNQEALRTHIRLTHSTNYNHKCTMCDKAFKRPYALREHMATHTGTALYTCPWCPKTFISNGNMHNHRKKAHPQEWEEAHRKKFAHNLPSDQNSLTIKDKLSTE